MGTVLSWRLACRAPRFARGIRALASRTAKLARPFPPPGGRLDSRPLASLAGEAPRLVGLGDKLYRDYIEHLVRTMPCEEVIAAGGEELSSLEHHCAATGQDLIDGISPVLDAFFQYVQGASPGIWSNFTCQDAVVVIHDRFDLIEVLDTRSAHDPALRDDAVFGFFLYCSYIIAMAAHDSLGVRTEIGIRSGPVLH